MSRAKTDKVSPGTDQVPRVGILAIGAIFSEGEPHYGRDNWKLGVGDLDWQRERYRHAFDHLMRWNEGDRSEDHLAKVGWFSVIMLWIREEEQKLGIVPTEVIPSPPGPISLPEQVKAKHVDDDDTW